MKKSSTWYLLILALLNLLLGLGTGYSTELWKEGYHGSGVQLPAATLFALQTCWWPDIFAGLMGTLALISIRSRWASPLFFHFLIWLLVLECFILFVEQFLFLLPLITLMNNLK